MATNKYFNLYHQKNEQKLVQSLIEEAVKIHGIDAVYIPRKQEKIDPIFREDVLSHFDDYHFIELYVKNIDSFDGDQDIFKKFGLEINNQITFSMSRSSFAKILGKEFLRPREGDLIYLPMSTASGLYEIKFVKEDTVFYELGEFYIYDLQCELFTSGDEQVKTGLEDVDQVGTDGSYHTSITLGEGVGDFQVGEIAYQGVSEIGADAKGTVVSWNDPTLVLENIFGTFDVQYGPVKGKSATYALVQTESNISMEGQNEKFDESTVLYFDEHNPFSEEDL